MSLLSIVFFALISFLISFLLFPVVISIFKKINWFDTPGTHKIHSADVPSMGGVAILTGAVLSLLMALPLQQWLHMKYFFIAIALMFLVGLRDDVLALTPKQKLLSQLLPVFVMVFLYQVRLKSFYEIWPGSDFYPLVALGITLLTMVIITNAYNLIDGIDGLAGSVGLIILLFFGAWFYFAHEPFLSVLSLCFAGGTAAFLIFNWQPSKIFMGDTGALTLGIVIASFAIIFINFNTALPAAHPAKFAASVSTAICVLIVPLLDTLRVIIIRIRDMKSPFRADQNHLHHRLLAQGLSHRGAASRLAGLNILFIALALLMKEQSDYVILPIVLLLSVAFSAWIGARAVKKA